MAKPQRRYVCQSCGSVAHRWQGQCVDCNDWNTLVEEAAAVVTPFQAKHNLQGGGRAIQLVALDADIALPARRASGIAELDRALGGGFVNTELRELAEPRVFDYFDFVTLDAGDLGLRILIVLASATAMEGVAALVHRLWMHGPGWGCRTGACRATSSSRSSARSAMSATSSRPWPARRSATIWTASSAP